MAPTHAHTHTQLGWSKEVLVWGCGGRQAVDTFIKAEMLAPTLSFQLVCLCVCAIMIIEQAKDSDSNRQSERERARQQLKLRIGRQVKLRVTR